jgi:hypothetical protein
MCTSVRVSDFRNGSGEIAKLHPQRTRQSRGQCRIPHVRRYGSRLSCADGLAMHLSSKTSSVHSAARGHDWSISSAIVVSIVITHLASKVPCTVTAPHFAPPTNQPQSLHGTQNLCPVS